MNKIARKVKRRLRRMIGDRSRPLSSQTEVANEPYQPSRRVPKLTVVVPCYNQEEFVAATIHSVRQQSFSDWECIVIDDASTDASLATAWEAIDEDQRFRVVRHKVNCGLSASRNTGIRNARAATITFLDADDLLMKENLADRYSTLLPLQETDDVAGTFSGVAYGREDIQLDDLPSAQDWPDASPEKTTVDFITAGAECPFPANAPLLKTDIVEALGGFDESFRDGAEDWDLWQRILRNGYVFVPSTTRSALYRQRAGSMVRTSTADHARVGIKLIEEAYGHVDGTVLASPTSSPFPEPLGVYQQWVTQAARTVRFAAIAYASGNKDLATQLLGELPPLSGSVLGRHVDTHAEFVRGFKRSRAHVASDLGPIEDDIARAWPPFDRLLSRACQPAPQTIETQAPPIIDSLLVPSHPAQLPALISHATGVGKSFAVVDTQSETGPRGIDHLASKTLTINDLALRPRRFNRVIFGEIRDAHTDAVVRAVIDAGARPVRVQLDSERSMALPNVVRATDRKTSESRSDLGGEPGAIDATIRCVFREQDPVPGGISTVWSLEEDPTSRADVEALQQLRNKYRDERCVIIGNGPSLNDTDLSRLQDERTFAVNGIFYAQDRMNFDPDFYVVEDNAFLRDNLAAVKAYVAGLKLFPSIYRSQLAGTPNVLYFNMNRGFYEKSSPNFCVPRFATDVTYQIFSGQSVTFMNLQLAYHMGFTEVVLVGMDFSYVIPDSAEVSGDRILSREGDLNHFHPDYFGVGTVWKDPKLDRVLASYALAKSVFESDDRRIVNATVGGKLEIFERTDYQRTFG